MAGTLIDFGDLLTPSPRANARNRFRNQQPTANGDHDPALAIPGMPPGGAEYIVPHAVSFQGIFSSVSRVYRISDEALKASLESARYMLNDPVVTEPVELRQRSVALLNWNLEPEDKRDPTQKWLCERLTAILKVTPRFMQYREALMRAIWFGRYGVAPVYRWKEVQGQRRVCIGEWKPIHGDKLVFRYDDGSHTYDPNQVGIRVGAGYAVGGTIAGRWKIERTRKVEPTDYGLAYFLSDWERKLIAIHKHSIEDGEYEDPQSAGKIHGVGIRSKIYWCWYQKQELQAQLFEFLERSASGIEIWFYPWGNDAARQTVLKAAEERIGENRNCILVPRPEDNPGAYGYDRIEPSMAGAEQLKSIIVEMFNLQIKKYVLGQTLTTEQGSTGLGSNLADIHLGTFHQIVRYDASNCEETITTDTLRPLQQYNFPKFGEVPIAFKIQTEDEDAQMKLEAIKTAYDMRVPVKMDSVYDALGESKPEKTDQVLLQPPEPQPGMGMGPPPGEQPPGKAQVFGGLGGEETPPDEQQQSDALDQAIELDGGQEGQQQYAASPPSQDSNRVPIKEAYAKDAAGHEHRGKGPGGGEFIATGDGGGKMEKPDTTDGKFAEGDASENPPKVPAKIGRPAEAADIKTSRGETLTPTKCDETGKRTTLHGEPMPKHIYDLKIPPGANEVHVNLDPKGDRMAQWTDDKGRTQMKYGDTHTAQAAADKWGRVAAARAEKNRVRGEIDLDIAGGKRTEEASALRLITHTGMRPGSDTDTKAAHKSYGATTLEGRHVVTDENGNVSVKFVPGKKKGGEIEMPVTDPKIAKDLQERAAKAGPEGRLFETSAARVRDYSKDKDGGEIKTKDHRTVLGTETALAAVKEISGPTNAKEYKAAVKAVGEKVAARLGNTAAVAVKSYIDPHVFAPWQGALKGVV